MTNLKKIITYYNRHFCNEGFSNVPPAGRINSRRRPDLARGPPFPYTCITHSYFHVGTGNNRLVPVFT